MTTPTLASFVPALGHSLEGSKVVYVAPTLAEGAQLLRQIEDVIPGECKVYWTNGNQRVESPSGGFLRVISLRGSLWGASVDLVYLPSDTPQAVVEELEPALWVTGGEIRYY